MQIYPQNRGRLPRPVRAFVRLAAASLIAVACGCVAPPAGRPHPSAQHPCDNCMPGVLNFARVSPVLWRGAQPTREGFQSLARAGVTTVINLRIGDGNSDEPLLAGTGLRYVQIPMKAWSPDPEKLKVFLQEVDTVRRQGHGKVFVHCQQGRDRTGYSVATYRMVEEGWTPEQAIQEMFDFRFNRIWRGNPAFLETLDVARLKSELNPF